MPGPPLAPLASGLLLALSLPPFPSGPLPFVALIPFALWCARIPPGREGRRMAARGGLWLGLAFFGVLLHWVAFSLPGRPLLGASAYLSGVALMALVLALAGWLLHGALLTGRTPLWVALPLAWTATEWVRGSLPGGLAFPWGGSALALTGAPRALSLLPWVGENGVTLWIALVNGLLASAILRRREGRSWRRLAATAVVVVALPFGVSSGAEGSAGPPNGLPAGAEGSALPAGSSPEAGTAAAEGRDRGGVHVALLQTDVPVEVREDALVGADRMTASVERLLGSVETGSADLVVLPETAFPLPLEAPPGRPYLEVIERQAARLGASVLVGAFAFSDGAPTRAYNSVFVVDGGGVRGRYDKQRLVPVIERTPLAGTALLDAVGDTSSYAVGARPAPLVTGGEKVGALICFESAFAGLARRQRREGATLLVNVTNDAWFGGGLPGRSARAQHEAHAVLRAIEGRISVVRVANGGRSELVDPNGRRVPVAPLGEEGIRLLVVAPPGPVPPSVWIGPWIGPVAAVAAALLLLAGRRRRHAGAAGGLGEARLSPGSAG